MKPTITLIALICTSYMLAAHAGGPADFLYTPHVEEGEREIGLLFGTGDGDPRQSVGEIGVGFGVDDWWFTEAYVVYATGDSSTRYDASQRKNTFQLTENLKRRMDVGLITSVEFPRDHDEGINLRIGPLFQSELGNLQLNGIILFEKRFDAATSSPTEMAYQWQAKYHLQPRFEYGLQGFGSLGAWNNWDTAREQSHKMGPAIFGTFSVGNHQTIRSNAAWLFGVSNGAPNNTFRLQAEMAF